MNILIADDHPLYREALELVIKELDDEVVIHQAETFHEVLSQIDNHGVKLDLILLDLYMEGGNWKDIISKLAHEMPEVPVIVITSSESHEDAHQAMEAGAHGYIPKSLGKQDILNAINLIRSQNISIYPRLRENNEHHKGEEEHERAIAKLTPRQREVLIKIGAGKSNKIIARELSTTEGTVKLHVAAILKTLGVTNRTQAALISNRYEHEHKNRKQGGHTY
jgi:DNA-binding NarL/FixJ family response regulator